MESQWALLFDLDQTLVMTEAIQSMRDNRQWREIARHYHLTRLPEHTKAFLERVRGHFRLGVVTASPRQYAEELLKYHHLDLKVVTAYHDTRGHKPDPDPLLHAAAQLNIDATHCIHVGDHTKDIIAAHHANMRSIALSWDGSLNARTLPDYSYTVCTNWHEVIIYLKKVLQGR